MEGFLRRAARPMAVTVANAIVFYTLGYFSLHFTRSWHGTAAIWPGDAVALCVMLRLSRNGLEDALIFFGVMAAGLAANFGAGLDPFLATTFALINAGEIAMGVLIARHFAPLQFRRSIDGWRFCAIVGLAPPAVGALCAGFAALVLDHSDALGTVRNWYGAHLMGFLVIGPYGMTLVGRQIRQLDLPRHLGEALLLMAGVATAAQLAFGQNSLPLSFLVMPAALGATFRFRLLGAAAAIVIITAFAVPETIAGLGPFAVLGESTARIMLLGGFLVLTSLTCVVLAALLNERDIHRAMIDRRRKLAEQGLVARNRLLSHVSHEVKSPLTAIMGFGSLIESGVLSPSQVQSFAALIARHGALLKTLADDLLAATTAEAGGLTLRSESLVVSDVLDELALTVAAQSGDKLVIHPLLQSLRLQADPQRYAQVLNNLVSNALKYGRGQGAVEIEASDLADGFLRVVVSNGGPGIPVERQAALFTPFDRLGAENGPIDGAGIGLTIAKQLVELQGGRIDFDSTPGQRTRFWVDMPKAA